MRTPAHDAAATLDRVRAVLACEAEAIQRLRVDDSYTQAIEAILACRGKIITSGIGKAGFIARKFAAVLCSTGTPAVFINPAEAAHGDLGAISAGDCVFVFSTSGKTREVLELIEWSRHLTDGCVVGITSHTETEFRRIVDVIVDMGIIEEPCPLGLTPSASITVMSAISDAIALVVMERKGIDRHDYGLRHHGGYLGRKSRLEND